MGERSWPAWATQKVSISDWDPAWEQRAGELVPDLSQRLAQWLAESVEHVGSTAVQGLAAKPVVDLMAPVRSLVDAPGADAILAEAGWQLVPPKLDQRPWRRMYVLPEDDRRLAHLHLVELNHPRWRETLFFRDRLRQDPELAREYARVKRLAARAHTKDREAYTEAKSAFVQDVVGR
ncbi:MAG: GrpB family protein [Actinomycetota bacterium]|nr:GrpB family protein [Actinomycetota bacterium]